MADNVSITAGIGTVVGCDEVAGVQYQRVKPVWGVDGSVTDTSATNPMPVTLGTGTNTIGATKDAGVNWTIVRTYTTSADLTTAAAITAAPTGGQKLVLDDCLVSSAVASEFTIQEETSATVFASVFLPANGTAQITLRDGLKTAVADKKFFGKMSAAGNVRVTACYHSEA